MKGHEFGRDLRSLKGSRYTSVGSYPLLLVTANGGCLCMACVQENAANIRLAAMTGVERDWEPAGFDVNWEDPALHCDHCGERIESAYAEDEAAS